MHMCVQNQKKIKKLFFSNPTNMQNPNQKCNYKNIIIIISIFLYNPTTFQQHGEVLHY
jgi:hypothetical protein